MISWWASGTTASVPRIAASAAMAASCRSPVPSVPTASATARSPLLVAQPGQVVAAVAGVVAAEDSDGVAGVQEAVAGADERVERNTPVKRVIHAKVITNPVRSKRFDTDVAHSLNLTT